MLFVYANTSQEWCQRIWRMEMVSLPIPEFSAKELTPFLDIHHRGMCHSRHEHHHVLVACGLASRLSLSDSR
jgi:hypothetical protein